MKLSAVYKSSRKADTFLYVKERDNFTSVPSALMKQFGVPIFVMLIPVGKRDHIAGISTVNFIEKVQQQGFYLQLPPKTESLLKDHLKANQTHTQQS